MRSPEALLANLDETSRRLLLTADQAASARGSEGGVHGWRDSSCHCRTGLAFGGKVTGIKLCAE